MKKVMIFASLAAAMAVFSACGGDETYVDKAQNALESAQNAVGEAADTKASQLADAAVGDMDIPDMNGGTELPDIDSLTE